MQAKISQAKKYQAIDNRQLAISKILTPGTLTCYCLLPVAYCLIFFVSTTYAQPAVLTPPPKPIGDISTISSTSSDKNKASTAKKSPESSSTSAPFAPGEKLTYNVTWGTFPTAARIELRVSERGTFFGKESYQINAKVQTLDQLGAMFGEIDNRYTSYISIDSAIPHRMINSVRQGGKLEEETIEFDQIAQQATFSNGQQLKISGGAFDIASLIYGIRLQPFQQSGNKKYNVIYNKEVIPVVVELKGKERISVQTGSYETVIIKFTPKKHFNGKSITVWFSDDEKKIPVASIVEFSFGKVRVELASMESPPSRSTHLKDLAELKHPVDESGTPTSNIKVKGNGTNGNDRPLPPLPFSTGERLLYDVGWGSFDTAARAVFEVRRAGAMNNNRVFEFTGELTSTGSVREFIDLNESLSSYSAIDANLTPIITEWKIRDGKPIRRGTPPPRVGSYDLLSMFYSIRAAKMNTGATRPFTYYDGENKLVPVIVRAVKTEVINTKLGNRETIQFDIVSAGTNPILIAQAWLSNDDSRIPLYFVTRTSFGELRFQISKIF